MPVAMANIGAAEHAHIDPVNLRMIAAAAFACLRTSLESVAPGLKLAEMERDQPCKMIRFRPKHWISAPLRQRKRLVDEARGPAQAGANVIDVAESPQSQQEIRLALQFAAEFLCTLVCSFCLARSESLGCDERSTKRKLQRKLKACALYAGRKRLGTRAP